MPAPFKSGGVPAFAFTTIKECNGESSLISGSVLLPPPEKTPEIYKKLWPVLHYDVETEKRFESNLFFHKTVYAVRSNQLN